MCLRCFAKEQIGTIWCYSCGCPMEMQEKLPLTHAQILSMTQDSSKKLLQELGLRVRETDSTAPHRIRGPRRRPPGDTAEVTVGGLTWAQRMREWRKAAYKKRTKPRKSTDIDGPIGRSVNDGAANPHTNSAVTRWRSNTSAATSTGTWLLRLMSWAGVKKPQHIKERKRGLFLVMNAFDALPHELRCEAHKLVVQTRGPDLVRSLNSVRSKRCDLLGKVRALASWQADF